MTNLTITTSTHLEGFTIHKQLGIVQGITVRSRGLGGNVAGSFMAMFGGKSSIYTDLCEKARQEALDIMVSNALKLGANAIINMRYESNEVMQGMTEVLAYGTAVYVEPSI